MGEEKEGMSPWVLSLSVSLFLSVYVCLPPLSSPVCEHITVSLFCQSMCMSVCLSLYMSMCLPFPCSLPTEYLTVCLTVACQTPRVLSNLWHNAASVEKILGTKNKLEDSGAGSQNYEEKHSEDAMKNIWGL